MARQWRIEYPGALYHVLSKSNGGQGFVPEIRDRFLADKKDVELPQHNTMFRELDYRQLLKKASSALRFDIESV